MLQNACLYRPFPAFWCSTIQRLARVAVLSNHRRHQSTAADVDPRFELVYTISDTSSSRSVCAHFRGEHIVMAANRILEVGSLLQAGSTRRAHGRHSTHKTLKTTKTTICVRARSRRLKPAATGSCGNRRIWRVVKLLFFVVLRVPKRRPPHPHPLSAEYRGEGQQQRGCSPEYRDEGRGRSDPSPWPPPRSEEGRMARSAPSAPRRGRKGSTSYDIPGNGCIMGGIMRLAAVLLMACVCGAAWGDEFTPLFNAKNLDGWKERQVGK